MQRPKLVWILIILLLFLAFGGFFGGIGMLIDPSGKSMQMDTVLPLLPVANYVLPGLFLLVVMGVFPLVLVYGLIKRTNWAWLGSVTVGVILAIWLIVQGLLIGFKWPIQYITAINGLLILGIAFLPAVKRFYQAQLVH